MKPTTECRHNLIVTYKEANGPLRMWACTNCKIRFYPACSVCIDVGHREEVHVELPEIEEPEVPSGGPD